MTVLIKVHLAVKGQKRISQASPIVISITKLTCFDEPTKKRKKKKLGKKRAREIGWGSEADPYPGVVKLTLVERDTWTLGDDVVADNIDKKKAIEDDEIVTIPGTLRNRPKAGVFFEPDQQALAKAVTSVANASGDRAWFNFDGRAGAPFEVSIPKAKHEGDESHFFEFSAILTELPTGVEKFGETVTVAAVRRPRSRHRMLAVEPLAQAKTSANSKLLGVLIEAFHPDASHEDKTKLKDRAWSNFMLRRTSETEFQSKIVDSGCSLLAVTMVLRYLRVPKDDDFVSVYDQVIRPMLEKKSFKEKYAPHELLHDNGPALRKIKKASASYSGNKNKDKREALDAYLNDNGLETDPKFFGIDFKSEKLSDKGKAYVRPATIKAHYFPVMLLWYMRQKQGSNDSYQVEVLTARKQVLKQTDGVTTLELEDVAQIIRPADQQKGLDTSENTYYANAKGHAFPLTSAMKKDFGVTTTAKVVKSLGAGWTKFVKNTIDKGLPLIAIMSPGVYTAALGLARTSGHWIVITGYRTDEKGNVWYIINDPARGGAMQYDALNEQQLGDWLDATYTTRAEEKNTANAAYNEKKKKKKNFKERRTDYTAEELKKEATKERELKGYNLFLDRRKLLTPKVLHVLEPRGWTAAHAKILEYDGRSKWTDKEPTAMVLQSAAKDPEE